nr:restriction endonuclease subunit S [Jannaschia pohangensis]
MRPSRKRRPCWPPPKPKNAPSCNPSSQANAASLSSKDRTGKRCGWGDVADIRIGGTPARKEPTYWQDGNNIWLSIADLGPKHLNSSKEQITDQGVAKSNVKLLPVGSVVMSFKLTIGKLGITAVPLYTNEAICGFVPRTPTSFHPEFLYQLLHVADLLQDVDQAVKGKTLNKAKLNELNLRMPGIAEQRRIADFMVSMDREVENWTNQLEKLRTEKKALMQQLLTGKRRVVV